jgi:hypothetical protein
MLVIINRPVGRVMERGSTLLWHPDKLSSITHSGDNLLLLTQSATSMPHSILLCSQHLYLHNSRVSYIRRKTDNQSAIKIGSLIKKYNDASY